MENKCKCCGKYLIKYPFEICPICGWQDDIVQNDDPNFFGGANELCLSDYKRFYYHNMKHLNNYIEEIKTNFSNKITADNIDLILSAKYVINFKIDRFNYKLKKEDTYLLIHGKKSYSLGRLEEKIESLENMCAMDLLKKANKIKLTKMKINA